MIKTPQREQSTWVEVDLGSIRRNLRAVLERTSTEVMVVVKANAYGHGAVPVARASMEAGASWCAVARADEALELREAGLDCPLMILGYIPPDRIGEMIENQVRLTFWDEIQARRIDSIAGDLGRTAAVHLKVDTGMSRLGVQYDRAVDLVSRLNNYPHLKLEGIFTHFARADEQDPTPTDHQEQRFREVIEELERRNLRPQLVHAANSAASLTRPSATFDLVRLGISLYGLEPSPQCPLPPDFRPALSWKSVLSQVKILPAGRGVSYGHIYTTKQEERLGTIPVGYADGYHRVSGSEVLVGGKRVPVVGRVCMDQIVVNLDQVPEARVGDEVVIIGEQQGAQYTADDLARVWNSINYEVVCAVADRVPRFYR
ncbi:MAG: alanine racemase [Anaerolineales bacterium]|nr:alanine racemase [Anaerolineales bacterium]